MGDQQKNEHEWSDSANTNILNSITNSPTDEKASRKFSKKKKKKARNTIMEQKIVKKVNSSKRFPFKKSQMTQVFEQNRRKNQKLQHETLISPTQ